MTEDMFNWITKWQRETFTKATAHSAAKHLEEEVKELLSAIDTKQDGVIPQERFRLNLAIIEEYADCFLLLFGSAALYGLDYEEICSIINDKMEVNKKRKWGKVNKDGYVKHIDP